MVYTAYRTSLQDQGREVEGWLLHEHIAFTKALKTNAEGQFFGRYHWIPVVMPGGLYLFEHSSVRGSFALRWLERGDRVQVEPLSTFSFAEVSHRADAGSGRARVPVSWRVKAQSWDLEIELSDRAGHTGYGPEGSRGKALYRQATATGKNASARAIYAMIELILEE